MVERYEAESCGGESWNLMFPQHAVAGSGVQKNHGHAGAAGLAIKNVAGGQICRGVGDLHFRRGMPKSAFQMAMQSSPKGTSCEA